MSGYLSTLRAGIGILFVLLLYYQSVLAQPRPIAIVGGILIDGTGRPPVEDAVVVFSGGRIQEVGKRGEVTIPRGAQVVDAKGKTILPGLIDGHCHYWEWLGELYLAYGVTTCPDINNSPTEWIIAQKEGIQEGQDSRPAAVDLRPCARRAAAAGDAGAALAARQHHRAHRRRSAQGGARPCREGHGRFQSCSNGFHRRSPRRSPDEARKLGRPVIGHSVNMWETIDAGYTSIEHTWAVMFTTIKDPEESAPKST